jgi:hypothetical protein
MPRVDREYIALAISGRSGRTRAMVQGLRTHELDGILGRVKEVAMDLERPHLALVAEVIKMLQESDTETIVSITEKMSNYEKDLENQGWKEKPGKLLEWSRRKPTPLFETHLFALREQSRHLDIMQSNNEYILYLLEHIKPHGSIGVKTEPNLYSKRIAEERKLAH